MMGVHFKIPDFIKTTRLKGGLGEKYKEGCGWSERLRDKTW